MNDNLLDIAMRFQIKPIKSFNGAINILDVISVLTNINKSYKNFIEIEFLKTKKFRIIYQQNDSIIKKLINELELFIVDLKYSSFEAALVPNFSNGQDTLFQFDLEEWKKEKYLSFKDDIYYGEFNNIDYINHLKKKYNKIERKRIFEPLFSTVHESKNYDLNIKIENGKIEKRLVLPLEEKIHFYIPKKEKPEKKNYATIQAFMKIEKEGNLLDIKTQKIKKIFYVEELKYDTYPFKPDIIKYNDNIFNLIEKLECQVEFIEDNYIITNDKLDITVWGSTREEAENAFAFMFYSIYQNFAKEDDKKLSDNAIKLKQQLLKLVKAEYINGTMEK
ncbi:MAG: hypothetical protein HZB41_06155 [Ignavibacteriae bacterium]|nr:hypothetical protein [Ignavibacteriota bacterium]